MDQGEVRDFAGGEVVVFSARCPGKATPNEDAVAIIAFDETRGLLAVADGMGGGPAGEQAAALAVQALVDASAAGGQPVLRDIVLNGLEAANLNVPAAGSGAGTTLVAAEIDGDSIRTYHVGDSAALVVGQRGRVKQLTISHSPTGYAVEAGVMNESEALHDDERHVVSNIVGSADMKIEIGPTLRLARRDTLLLATDGVLDNLRTEEICDLVRVGPLGRVWADLAAAVRERMAGKAEGLPAKPDDSTFVIYRPTSHRPATDRSL